MYVCIYVCLAIPFCKKNEQNRYANMFHYEKLLYLNKILNITNMFQFTT